MSSMSTDRGPNSDSGAFLAAKQGIEKAMRHVVEGERQKEAGEDLVLDTLKRVAQDYRLWTRRVVTVRTLQTITVLDIQSYRDLLWCVGGYESETGQTSLREQVVQAVERAKG